MLRVDRETGRSYILAEYGISCLFLNTPVSNVAYQDALEGKRRHQKSVHPAKAIWLLK